MATYKLLALELKEEHSQGEETGCTEEKNLL